MTLLQDSGLEVIPDPGNINFPSMRNDELLLGLLLCCLRTLTPNLGTLDAPAIATPSGEAQERRISLSTTHCTLETLGDLCLTLLQWLRKLRL
jgi:hypothetical protein